MQQPYSPPPPPMPVPMQGGGNQVRPSRRSILFGRWYRRMMSGAPAVGVSLPRWFTNTAIYTYLVALLVVNMMYPSRGTEWYFMLFGIVWVAGFFGLSRRYSKRWSVLAIHSPKRFEKQLFQTAFIIRAVYVIFAYFFYLGMTGSPFEFAAADSAGYTELAHDWARDFEEGRLWEILVETSQGGVSDMGFPLFLLIPSIIFGRYSTFVVRILNALIGAYMAVLIYRLAQRSMGEKTARFASIFCAFHPVLICYAGFSLKETLMTCILALFIERADLLLRNKNYTFGSVAPVVMIGMTLFMFRTVLGMVAFLAVLVTLLLIDQRVVSTGRKIAIGGAVAVLLFFAVSDRITREVQKIVDTDVLTTQERTMVNRYGSAKGGKDKGNSFADYAGVAVFAPLIFTIPFPTMVNVGDQQDMRLIHGGNWMRNVMSGFVILAMVMLLLSGDWRQYTLSLSIMLGYLLMLSFSVFAHSLRFHVPAMPFEMMFAAYAVTSLRKKQVNWYTVWCLFMIVICIGWNWVKLKGRGM